MTVVLVIEPSQLYVIGAAPTDPVKVGKAPVDQFQRPTWANKVESKRKLFSIYEVGRRGFDARSYELDDQTLQ